LLFFFNLHVGLSIKLLNLLLHHEVLVEYMVVRKVLKYTPLGKASQRMLYEYVNEKSSRKTSDYISNSQHKNEVKTDEHSLRHSAVNHLDDNGAYETRFEHNFAKN